MITWKGNSVVTDVKGRRIHSSFPLRYSSRCLTLIGFQVSMKRGSICLSFEKVFVPNCDASHVAVMRSDCDLLVLSFVQLVQMVSFRVLPVAVSVLIFCVTATMTVAIWATSRTAVSTFAVLCLGSQIEIRSVHEENPLALCTCSVRELTGADPTVRRASYASFVCMTEISSSHS